MVRGHLKRAIERDIVYPLANLLATEQVSWGTCCALTGTRPKGGWCSRRKAKGQCCRWRRHNRTWWPTRPGPAAAVPWQSPRPPLPAAAPAATLAAISHRAEAAAKSAGEPGANDFPETRAQCPFCASEATPSAPLGRLKAAKSQYLLKFFHGKNFLCSATFALLGHSAPFRCGRTRIRF